MYDLIAQGVTIIAVVYFGWHLRTQLRTVKSTVEAQKATIEAQAEQMKTLKTAIDAQAEQMKAQSMVLQDVERNSKIMQQVIDFFNPQAQLQREKAYRDRFDRDLQAFKDNFKDDMMREVLPRLQEAGRVLTKELQRRETLEGQTPEDKHQDQPHASPSHELTAGANTDRTSTNQS